MEHRAFQDVLREARLDVALSQRELAELAGLSVQAVSDLERGRRRRPHPFTVRQLAAALGLEGERRTAFILASRGRDAPAPTG